MAQDYKDRLAMLLNSGMLSDDSQEQNDIHADDIPVKSKERLCLSFERKGRGGKCVTIISGFSQNYSDSDIEDLAAKLKRKLGTGGSARGGEILIQGDRREELRRLLKEDGHQVVGV